MHFAVAPFNDAVCFVVSERAIQLRTRLIDDASLRWQFGASLYIHFLMANRISIETHREMGSAGVFAYWLHFKIVLKITSRLTGDILKIRVVKYKMYRCRKNT